MKTILLIADHTAATENAARQVLNIARHLHFRGIYPRKKRPGVQPKTGGTPQAAALVVRKRLKLA